MKRNLILTLILATLLISSSIFIGCGLKDNSKTEMKNAGENVKEDVGNLKEETKEETKDKTESLGETIKYTAINFKDDVVNAGNELKDAIKNNKKDYFYGTETDYMVGDDYVRVYEYDDSNKIDADIKRISNDAMTVEGAKVDYTSKPYYYRKGNSLFVYEGNDPKYVTQFKEILGEPLR